MSKESRVNIAKFALVAAATITLNAPGLAEEEQTVSKTYECGGEKMQLTELDDGRLALEGKNLTGHVSIHRPTGMYRGSVEGWGSQHKTPEEALAAACRWLLKRAETQSEEALKKALHEFYESWKWEPK